MKLAALLATSAWYLMSLSLADPLSTAPQVNHRQQPLLASESLLEPAFTEKTSATASAKQEPVRLDTKVDSNWRQEMLDDVNSRRGEDGLSPLELSDDLNAMAQNHSDYQVLIHKMTHDDPNGSLGQRANTAGIKWSRLAENVAMGGETVAGVMSQWENSPHHLENILGDYNIVGFGLAVDGTGTKGTTYWTQDFAKTF
ncbi:hypothetical protein GGH91_003638 [Coemansia sp. RSA 2671]|nr:hypothetical protein GGH91_003638 [Coemansia sp. RSA 2671]